jgi:hypothetical protein
VAALVLTKQFIRRGHRSREPERVDRRALATSAFCSRVREAGGRPLCTGIAGSRKPRRATSSPGYLRSAASTGRYPTGSCAPALDPPSTSRRQDAALDCRVTRLPAPEVACVAHGPREPGRLAAKPEPGRSDWHPNAHKPRVGDPAESSRLPSTRSGCPRYHRRIGAVRWMSSRVSC